MKISYYKTENVTLDRLHELQGTLKELTQVNFDRLWKSMNEDGFAEPFVVWEDAADKKLYVVGGHQRLRVLKTKKEQGVKLPARFPCNFTRCKDKKAAVILCGRLASQYGRVTDEGLYQFAIDNELEPDFLKENFEFPGLNMERFIEGYFEDTFEPNLNPEISEKEINDSDIEKKKEELDNKFNKKQEGVEIICPFCGGQFSINK